MAPQNPHESVPSQPYLLATRQGAIRTEQQILRLPLRCQGPVPITS